MKRRGLPKVHPKDLWIMFFLLVLMAATVPSLPGSSGPGARLLAASAHVFSQVAGLVALR